MSTLSETKAWAVSESHGHCGHKLDIYRMMSEEISVFHYDKFIMVS